jgi:hypothetical protein
MLQDETVALEIDGQQVVEPRGPKVQNSISSEVAIMEAQRCVLWNSREEEVSE